MAEPEESGEKINYEAVEASPEFQELVKKRRAFVFPATIFYLVWYMGFILLAAYAESFMARSVYEGLTVGYVLALTQFLMVLVLGLAYLRLANNTYDPLAEKAIEKYAGHSERYAKADYHGQSGDADSEVGSRAAGSAQGAER